jgi:hypothetical protein
MKVRAVPGATHGWFEFRSGDRQLLVKNINFSTAETMTGADLVYVSRDPDCVVLVQYKLLKEAGTPPVLVFKDKKRLLKLVAGHLPAHQALAQLNHLVLVPRGHGLVPPIKSSVHIARDRGRNHGGANGRVSHVN